MKTLYESILDDDEKVTKDTKKRAERVKFENDLDYQRKVLLKILLSVFNKCRPYDNRNSIAFLVMDLISTRELNKKIKELSDKLEKLEYFTSISLAKTSSDVFTLKCTPPISEQYLFPEVNFRFVVPPTKLDEQVIYLAIVDTRDYNYNWKELYKKL